MPLSMFKALTWSIFESSHKFTQKVSRCCLSLLNLCRIDTVSAKHCQSNVCALLSSSLLLLHEFYPTKKCIITTHCKIPCAKKKKLLTFYSKTLLDVSIACQTSVFPFPCLLILSFVLHSGRLKVLRKQHKNGVIQLKKISSHVHVQMKTGTLMFAAALCESRPHIFQTNWFPLESSNCGDFGTVTIKKYNKKDR